MLSALILSGIVAGTLQLPPLTGTSKPALPAPETPYSRLFDPSQQGAPPQTDPEKQFKFEIRKSPAPRTKVVCGMTLIIVDGTHPDEEMVRPRPKDGVKYTMRRMAPPACGKDDDKDNQPK